MLTEMPRHLFSTKSVRRMSDNPVGTLSSLSTQQLIQENVTAENFDLEREVLLDRGSLIERGLTSEFDEEDRKELLGISI